VSLIYKILSREEWAAAQSEGRFEGSTVDLADSYIHFSTAAQAAETLAKHFSGRGDLMLAAVEAVRLGPALKWEPSRGGALFPHLYDVLSLDAVIWARPIPTDADGAPTLEPLGL